MKRIYTTLFIAAACIGLFGLLLLIRDSRKSAEYAESYQRLCIEYVNLNQRLGSPKQLSDPAYVHGWNHEIKDLLRRSQGLDPVANQRPAQTALTNMLLNQVNNLSEIERCAVQGNRKALGDRFLQLCDTMAYDLSKMKSEATKSGIDDLTALKKLEFGMSRFQI